MKHGKRGICLDKGVVYIEKKVGNSEKDIIYGWTSA